MAEKQVSELTEIADALVESDLIHVKRGVGTDSDKKITSEKVIGSEVDISTTSSVNLSNYYGDVVITASNTIIITLSGVLPVKRKLSIINEGTGVVTIGGLFDLEIHEDGAEVFVSDGISMNPIGVQLKQYVGEQTYNSVLLAVTNNNGDDTIFTRSVFVPYQTLDGTYRLKGNISFFLDIGSNTSIAIVGITFKNIPFYAQACAVSQDSANAGITYCYASPNTNVIFIGGCANGGPSMLISFDVELEAKPTWMD